ncbi:hypothetical protein MVEN_00247600 [Mycena venus]|uniref:Uncharacterized protein n=1 Tax=Mycena venus TaxID=2733690 RepID=A0A8H6Z3I8_9AGAR|nr:hypothetical protein MVEN_00247600 [Mycena venus]
MFKAFTKSSATKSFTVPSDAISSRDDPVASLDADTEIAKTTLTLCAKRDEINTEIEEMHELLLKRLGKLVAEEAAEVSDIEALKETVAALEAQVSMLDADINDLQRSTQGHHR